MSVPERPPVRKTRGASHGSDSGAIRNPERYGAAALERAARDIATAPPGNRHGQTFRAAASIGEVIAAGALSETEALEVLTAAAIERAGDGDKREAAATVRDGIRQGMGGASAAPAPRAAAPERQSGREPTKRPHKGPDAPAPAGAAPAAAYDGPADFEARRGLPAGYLAADWNVTEGRHKGRPVLFWPSAPGMPRRWKALDGKRPKYGWEVRGGSAHLYGLPLALERLAADPWAPLYVVNGEPSVWAAGAAGNVAAVCLAVGEGAAGTAAKLAPDLAAALEGIGRPVAVRVVYDADGAGRDGGAKVAAALANGGMDAAALHLAYWQGWQAAGMPPGADAGDMFQAAGAGRLAAALASLPAMKDNQAAEPTGAAKGKGAVAGPPIFCAADVEARRASWLWRPYIPRGVITFLTGEPSAGKSWIAVTLAAAVSKGRGLPGALATEPGRVLYLTAEDDLHVTIRPRLEEAGADLSRVFLAGEAVTLTDPEGLAWLLEAVDDFGPDLVIIDTLSAFFGGKADFHKANEARMFSAPLAALAAKSGAAFLVLRHGSKAAGRKVGHIGQGSVDFTAAARSEILAGVDPNDDKRRALVHTKANMGPKGSSLGYQIEALEDDPDRSRFTWTGETDLTAGDLMACDYQASEEPGNLTREDAETHVLNMISDGGGEASARDIEDDWKARGGSKRTLERAYSALRETTRLRHRREGRKDGGRGSAGVVYYLECRGPRSTPPNGTTPPDDLFIVGGGVNTTPPEALIQQGFSNSAINSAATYEEDAWRSSGQVAELGAEPAPARLPGEV